MDDSILQNDQNPVAPVAPPEPVQDLQRMDRLEAAMGQLTDTVRDAANRLTQAPAQAPPRTNDEFLNDLASDPQGVIQRVAADTFRKAAAETLNPAVLQVLDTASKQLLSAQQQKVDQELGEGTFQEIFRPQLDRDLEQLRQVNPRAMADPATIDALVNRLYGGENFPVLMERRKSLEKQYSQTGRSHMLPSGGIPRLRQGGAGGLELPDDALTFLNEVERATGETIDRKEYAKLYHTGVETGPGRHRTTILDFLKATGADPDKVKMYGGERG